MITHAPNRVGPIKPKRLRNDFNSLTEHCRALLDRLHWPLGERSRPLGTLGITSCHDGEGVSTVAAHLAIAAAGVGDRRVLLVDCNPAKPSVERNFGVKAAPGWVEILMDGDQLADAVQESGMPNLKVLAAGGAGDNRNATPDSASFGRLINTLTRNHDLVVLDMPSAASSHGAIPPVGLLDGVLLVIEAERIRWEVAQRTKELLTQAGAQLLGVVLNKRQEHVPDWLYRTL